MEEVKNVNKENTHIKREFDSVDDFEHLGHDSSPLKEKVETGDLLGLSQPVSHSEINKRVETVGSAITDVFDPLVNKKMDSNVHHMGDHFFDKTEIEPKVDKYSEEFGATSKAAADKFNIQAFLDNEKQLKQDEAKIRSSNDLLDRYSDSEPEQDDFKPSKYENFPKKDEISDAFGSTENFRTETFKDVEDYHFEPPKKETEKEKILDPIIHSVPKPIPEPVRQKTPEPVKEKTPEPVKKIITDSVKENAPEIIKEKTPEPVKEKKLEPVEEKTPEPLKKQPDPPKKTQEKITQTKPKIAPADAEAIFCKMGLDTWFNPEKLNPKVESLIYWRDPKKSGPVFGGVLIILLALTYFSLISVVAYLSLIGLGGTIAFRIYKNIVQAVQKTGDGHPFKDLLELDVSLPHDKVKEISEVAVAHINAAVVELRRLFLVEDLVDSIKFGVLLWTLTYLGAWFNGMTLIIIAWVALFTLPKVYETNKTQIDANLEIVRTKLAEITSKVKAAIPIGKKAEEKKEQ